MLKNANKRGIHRFVLLKTLEEESGRALNWLMSACRSVAMAVDKGRPEYVVSEERDSLSAALDYGLQLHERICAALHTAQRDNLTDQPTLKPIAMGPVESLRRMENDLSDVMEVGRGVLAGESWVGACSLLNGHPGPSKRSQAFRREFLDDGADDDEASAGAGSAGTARRERPTQRFSVAMAAKGRGAGIGAGVDRAKSH